MRASTGHAFRKSFAVDATSTDIEDREVAVAPLRRHLRVYRTSMALQIGAAAALAIIGQARGGLAGHELLGLGMAGALSAIFSSHRHLRDAAHRATAPRRRAGARHRCRLRAARVHGRWSRQDRPTSTPSCGSRPAPFSGETFENAECGLPRQGAAGQRGGNPDRSEGSPAAPPSSRPTKAWTSRSGCFLVAGWGFWLSLRRPSPVESCEASGTTRHCFEAIRQARPPATTEAPAGRRGGPASVLGEDAETSHGSPSLPARARCPG